VSVPWIKIIKSKPVWGITLVRFLSGWGFDLLYTKLPSYLNTAFGISILQNSLFNALTTLADGIATLLGGPLSEFVIIKTNLSRTRVRKIFEYIALIGASISIGLVPAMGCDYIPIIALIAATQLFFGLTSGGDLPIPPEIAPEFSGTVHGCIAATSYTSAIIAPYLAGLILDKKV
jgi:MFS transporter, ACS family, solute carrier family 17 (sodium-dependent inorganic phosphate cotransporter), other